MRTPALAALSLAIPLLAASGGTPAAAGGWWDCDRPAAAYYSAPVRAYRYSYYAPSYYAPPARSYSWGYGPRVVGYGPGPYYRYRRPLGFYGAPYGYAYGPSVSIGVGF